MAYDHYTPSIIPCNCIQRRVFNGLYTYQPEIAQGTLQYIFEFQSMITDLTGMAVNQCIDVRWCNRCGLRQCLWLPAQTKLKKFLIADNLYDHVKDVIKTYAKYRDIEIITVLSKDGLVDRDDLKEKMDGASGFIGQIPNKFGLIENLKDVSDMLKEQNLISVIYADPQV